MHMIDSSLPAYYSYSIYKIFADFTGMLWPLTDIGRFIRIEFSYGYAPHYVLSGERNNSDIFDGNGTDTYCRAQGDVLDAIYA